MDIEADRTFAQASLSRSDVDKALAEKRNHGERRACYPCSTRKVKCDRSVPCQTCLQRGHPDLCIPSGQNRERIAPRRRLGTRRAPSARPSVTDATSPAPRVVSHQVPEHADDDNETSAPAKGLSQPTFVGQNSLPSLVNTTPYADGSPADDMRHALGLQNTWDVYPYLERSPVHDPAKEVSLLVPAHQDVLR
jgi:hypothetical protein